MRRTVAALVSIGFLAFAALPALAEAELGFMGIGAHVGLVSPENLDSALGFGAHADLGTLAENVHLEGNIDYWSVSKEESWGGLFGSTATWKWSYRDIGIGGTVKYYFGEPDASVRFFGGGGLGLHLLKATFEGKGDYSDYYGNTASTSDTKVGLDLVGGANFGSSENLKFFAEARYRVVSDFSQFCLWGGVTHYFSR